MPNLIMLIGNIGSGKSSLVKHLVNQGYIVVCRDALRYMAGGGEYLFDTDLEPILFKIDRYTLREMSNAGYNIVIDETNMSTTIRGRHFDCIKNKGYEAIAIVMPKLSKVESVQRRMSDNHGYNDTLVWGDVWERFDKIYTEPSKEEGFNKIIILREGVTWDTIAKDL